MEVRGTVDGVRSRGAEYHLRVVGRVPRGVEEYHARRRREVEAEIARTRRDEKQPRVAILCAKGCSLRARW